ncbi:MAG TPA: DNA-primase RepB domain-containing protein, partial [Mesotoga sp.]|nr:DNA-primase RepB domain-containing protein [Mesotoga sp.]
MTQKKSPAHTGPTTQTSDNSDNLIIADCLEFLKSLYPERTIGDGMEAFLEVRFLQPGTVPETKFISIVEISPETVRKLIEKGERARKNVYFGVGARNKKAGKKEDIGYISTAWLDIDEKDGISKGEAVKLLREWQHKPSYIIDSGHGIHAYWFLREPIFEPPEFERIEIINKALAVHFNGDKQASNYAQPMRLPGSLNVKRE